MAKEYYVPDGDACTVLAYAGELMTGDDEDKRQALSMAVRASLMAFKDLNMDECAIFPLHRLLLALDDRDKGRQSKLLKPIVIANRPPYSSRDWMARALIAAALDLRRHIDGSLKKAWESVRHDVPTDYNYGQVKRWISSLKSGLAGHRDGPHYAYWNAYLEVKSKTSPSDRIALYEKLVAAARHHLAR